MKILVPNTLPTLPAELDVAGEVVCYDVRADIPEEHRDAEVLVVWGNGRAQLAGAAEQLRGLRLAQTVMAGADALLGAGFADDVVLANGVGLHDGPVAEHAMALILALLRKVPQLVAAQRSGQWLWEMSGRQELHTKPITTLLEARVLIWGFGSIGCALARLLSAFGARVRGAARSAGERGGFEVLGPDGLDAALADTDLLVMILPDTPETTGALDARRLAQLPEHAYLVNVGRGRTVDEDALVAALEAGRLAGAALDVFRQEPLPADFPLWRVRGLLVSPHSAGGRPIGAARLISEQVRALAEGRPLRNVVR